MPLPGPVPIHVQEGSVTAFVISSGVAVDAGFAVICTVNSENLQIINTIQQPHHTCNVIHDWTRIPRRNRSCIHENLHRGPHESVIITLTHDYLDIAVIRVGVLRPRRMRRSYRWGRRLEKGSYMYCNHYHLVKRD